MSKDFILKLKSELYHSELFKARSKNGYTFLGEQSTSEYLTKQAMLYVENLREFQPEVLEEMLEE